MMRSVKAFSSIAMLAACCGALTACAQPTRPAVLADAERASRTPAARHAATIVPQAFAQADAFRREADQAFEHGNIAGAAILAERAMVAYERATVVARIAQASRSIESATQSLDQTHRDLSVLQSEERRLAADLEAIETRIRVIKDAEPTASSGRTDPNREAARLAATRAIASDARLLCVAAGLIAANTDDLSAARDEVQQLEQSLVTNIKTAPIDGARKARARCLAALTQARRTSSTNAAPADAVLAELGTRQGVYPHRNELGVVVRFDSAGLAAKLDESNRARAQQVATVVVGHPDVSVVLVLRGRSPSRPDALMKCLTESGVQSDRIRVESVPMSDPSPAGANSVDIVLVTPGS